MNLVINRQLLNDCAAGIHTRFDYKREDGSVYQGKRVLFMTPWNGITLVGTYHLPYTDHPDSLRVAESEVMAFLDEINNGYPDDPIQREDVSFFHKGFLPMDGINPKTGEVMLTRHSEIHDHHKEDGIEGLVSVVGVKYTTARDVSEHTVTLASHKLGRSVPHSRSRQTRLAGGQFDRFDDFLNQAIHDAPNGIDSRIMERLVHHYGSEYPRILAYGNENTDWIHPLSDSSDILAAEIVHAVREEMAFQLSDVILRRTGMGAGLQPDPEMLKKTAALMGEELGWNHGRIKEEIDKVITVYQTTGH